MDHFCYACISVSCLSCFPVCSLQPCGHLLGKGWPLASLVCYVLLRFWHFPMWCPGSNVFFDCIDSDLYLLTYFACLTVFLVFLIFWCHRFAMSYYMYYDSFWSKITSKN